MGMAVLFIASIRILLYGLRPYWHVRTGGPENQVLAGSNFAGYRYTGTVYTTSRKFLSSTTYRYADSTDPGRDARDRRDRPGRRCGGAPPHQLAIVLRGLLQLQHARHRERRRCSLA